MQKLRVRTKTIKNPVSLTRAFGMRTTDARFLEQVVSCDAHLGDRNEICGEDRRRIEIDFIAARQLGRMAKGLPTQAVRIPDAGIFTEAVFFIPGTLKTFGLARENFETAVMLTQQGLARIAFYQRHDFGGDITSEIGLMEKIETRILCAIRAFDVLTYSRV